MTNLILRVLLLCYTLALSNALTCKTCELGDPSCVSSKDVEHRQCENNDDLCYSWFHRTGNEITVQRDCMSITAPEYSLAKQMIGNKDQGCIKRVRVFDCFSFCSDDLCN